MFSIDPLDPSFQYFHNLAKNNTLHSAFQTQMDGTRFNGTWKYVLLRNNCLCLNVCQVEFHAYKDGYTETIRNTLTLKCFYTRTPLHTNAFTHKPFGIHRLLKLTKKTQFLILEPRFVRKGCRRTNQTRKKPSGFNRETMEPEPWNRGTVSRGTVETVNRTYHRIKNVYKSSLLCVSTRVNGSRFFTEE